MSFLARSFSAVLFNSPDPLEEPMPSIDDDFMIALWSICREITHEVTKVRSKPVTPAAKPWSKERFVPVSKFTKGNFCLLIISLHFFLKQIQSPLTSCQISLWTSWRPFWPVTRPTWTREFWEKWAQNQRKIASIYFSSVSYARRRKLGLRKG